MRNTKFRNIGRCDANKTVANFEIAKYHCAMAMDTLERYRRGLAEGRFTMAELSRAAKIPMATLSDMRDAGWNTKAMRRLQELERAMEAVSATKRPAPKPTCQKARAPA